MTQSEDSWIAAGASVIGTSHLALGTPCQDSHHIFISKDGSWVAVAVSDGAGSAARSQESSALVARSFARKLNELSDQFATRAPGAWVNDFVIQQVLTVREELRTIAQSDVLSSFHCTLVACLLGPSGGFAIHIGDGVIFGGSSKRDSNAEKISLDVGPFLSPPENAEYANETFFITVGDWIKHLRITPLPRCEWVMLATDGGAALCTVAESVPKGGFVGPLLTLCKNESDSKRWGALLTRTITDAQADKLTNDDKTLVVCMRRNIASVPRGVLLEYGVPVPLTSETISSVRRQTNTRPIHGVTARSRIKRVMSSSVVSRPRRIHTIKVILFAVFMLVVGASVVLCLDGVLRRRLINFLPWSSINRDANQGKRDMTPSGAAKSEKEGGGALKGRTSE